MSKQRKQVITVLKMMIIIILCVLIFKIGKKAYAYLFSSTSVKTNIPVAKWNIKLNNTNIVTTNSVTIDLTNVTWTNSHANSTTIAPGSTGSFDITIDPSGSDVAIDFYITYDDHTTDTTKILTVSSLALDGVALTKNANGKYAGTFTLAEALSGTTKTLTIGVAWVNDEANNDSDSEIGLGTNTTPEYMTLHFEADQKKS